MGSEMCPDCPERISKFLKKEIEQVPLQPDISRFTDRVIFYCLKFLQSYQL